MRNVRLGVVLACILTGHACGPAPVLAPSAAQPIDWRRLVGCYRTSTVHFALDSLPATHLTLLTPPLGAWQAWSYWSHDRNAYWRLLPGDTVEYVAGNSLYGGRYRWVVRGDELVGRYSGWTDIAGVKPGSSEADARREPCSTDGRAGSPPPNAAILQELVPASVAAVIADSVLPSLSRSIPVYLFHAGNPHGFSARVANLLSSDPRIRADGDEDHAIRLHAEGFSLDRDRLSVDVVTRTCTDQPAPNLVVERIRFRFVARGSEWQRVGRERLDPAQGTCGAHLAVPPVPPPSP